MGQDLWGRDRAEVQEEAHGVEEVARAVLSPPDREVFVYAPIAATRKVTKWGGPAAARVAPNAVRK